MKLENQSFDKKLAELRMQIATIQSEIQTVEKEKQTYINNLGKRKEELLANSVALDEIGVEVHDGIFFLVFKDDDFEYVARLTKDQAEHFADELDDQINDQINHFTDNELSLNNVLMNNFLNSLYAPK